MGVREREKMKSEEGHDKTWRTQAKHHWKRCRACHYSYLVLDLFTSVRVASSTSPGPGTLFVLMRNERPISYGVVYANFVHFPLVRDRAVGITGISSPCVAQFLIRAVR